MGSIMNCNLAVESSSRAFLSWKNSSAHYRRELFVQLAKLLREKEDEIKLLMQLEINCSSMWSTINVEDSIKIIEEAAALTTSLALNGIAPQSHSTSVQALILNEPLGVILGIAPWNSPLILGFRAVVAPVAAGNTAILKGSELSPRTHHFIASVFQEAGFPPGVLNFLVHREEDAGEVFKALIERQEVRKCNFTGSTPVGRLIASKAAMELKPVLLELGGKNYAVIFEDADLEQAAKLVLEDLVLVANSVMDAFREKLLSIFQGSAFDITISPVRMAKSAARIRGLVTDAESKGARVTELTTKSATLEHTVNQQDIIPATIIENMDTSMSFYSEEAFGPLLGIIPFSSQAEATQVIQGCPFGLSAAIFTRNHFSGLQMAKTLRVGAVHMNGATVHDESTLPHGGHGDSGWGRFGAGWGLEEFTHTKTVIMNE
ncbi:Salicylaldehyde dehydrogenase [Lachnellula arida]|uniref:Salicylaldehyde dehydrogenase n=1 Tax=Lachnellula arida TaxID=1316785 RepID=A0A8T9B663_9HELO|nr:Salicylaldehyde dehydrogenase [Lachnellula arida]